jgi:hypothetical protein
MEASTCPVETFRRLIVAGEWASPGSYFSNQTPPFPTVIPVSLMPAVIAPKDYSEFLYFPGSCGRSPMIERPENTAPSATTRILHVMSPSTHASWPSSTLSTATRSPLTDP